MSLFSPDQKHSKRVKTQPSGYSAFDQSIVLLLLTKIQKALHQISKHTPQNNSVKHDNLSASIKLVTKDMDILSAECRDRQRISLLITHLVVFDLLKKRRFDSALEVIVKKERNLGERTGKFMRLSIELLRSLVLRYLLRQQQSRAAIRLAISQIDLKTIKIGNNSSDQKIIQLTIICITIIAQQFSHFQNQDHYFKDIYREAYQISHKYLTQYHKLTETLFSICSKFPDITYFNRKKQKKHIININKRNSLPLSNFRILQSRSDRSYLNLSIQQNNIQKKQNNIGQNKTYEPQHNSRLSKRLKTLQSGSIWDKKERYLNVLYANPIRKGVSKNPSLKRNKMTTSLKGTAYFPEYASEMNQLNKISKIYLPKLQAQKKKKQTNGKQKLNAVQVLKFVTSLSKLKPKYFDKIATQESQISLQNSINLKQVTESQKASKKQKQINAQNSQNKKEMIKISATHKIQQSTNEPFIQTVLPELKNNTFIQQKQKESCQLI